MTEAARKKRDWMVALYGAVLCLLGLGAYFALAAFETTPGTVAGPALGVLIYVLLGKAGVAAMFIIPGTAVIVSALFQSSAKLGRLAMGTALSLCALLFGSWLIGHGWLVIGGSAVMVGGAIFCSILKPDWLGVGALALFWAGWSGYGAFVMLREGRYLAFMPVLFVFLLGLNQVRGLFSKKTAPKTQAAAGAVIEGQVTATREEPTKPIQPE